VFGEKRTQKLSPGLIKDQHGLFYFFSRSLLKYYDDVHFDSIWRSYAN